MAQRRVTLADVSRAAGVGPATVSRALAADERQDVSAATRERVRRIARELGYRPSAAARALRGGGHRMLSAIVPDTAWGWYEPIMLAAYRAAAAAGYRLVAHPIAGLDGGAAAVIEGMDDMPSEGVLLFGQADRAPVRDAAQRRRMPLVCIDDSALDVLMPTLGPDNRAGAASLVTHLLETGRRRIAVLCPDAGASYNRDRIDGYRQALDHAHITYDPRLVLQSSAAGEETSAAVPELEELLKDDPAVDALFCLADLSAAPALRTLRALGLSIPRDIAVAGFDDERAARLYDPPLTTVRQPYSEMGQLAVEMLIRAIQGEPATPVRTTLPTELIVRGSTTAAAA